MTSTKWRYTLHFIHKLHMIIFISANQSHGSVILYIAKCVYKINPQIRIIMSKLLCIYNCIHSVKVLLTKS